MSQKIDTQESSSKLLNATQIAFVASILLHLLIYKYGFPQLMIRDKKVSLENTVATIELNPFEAARLPNTESRWEIPDFKSSSLDGIASPFAFPSSITPIPGTFPNLPSIPVPFPPNFNFPSISTDIELPPIGDFSALPLPPPLEDFKSPTSPTSIPELPSSTIKPPPKTSPKSPPENKTKPKVTPEQIAAVRQQKLQENITSLSSSLQKQEAGTTDEDARKNYLTWLTKVKTIEPEAIEIEGIYPRDACIRRLEGKTVYGVVVDGKNTVVALELIKSAKYPIFNQQANKDIRKKNIGNNTGQPKPYRVTVNYKYNAEICPSLTVPSLRKKTETPTPQTTEETPTTPETPTPPTTEETPITQETPTPPTTEETPTTPETPTPQTTEETSTPQETPLPSLRERLQNAPLLNDDSLRERLRNNPLPKKSN